MAAFFTIPTLITTTCLILSMVGRARRTWFSLTPSIRTTCASPMVVASSSGRTSPVGYGGCWPDVTWPNGARLAVLILRDRVSCQKNRSFARLRVREQSVLVRVLTVARRESSCRANRDCPAQDRRHPAGGAAADTPWRR